MVFFLAVPGFSHTHRIFFFLILLLVYGGAGSLLLRRLFSSCEERGLLSSWDAGFSPRWLILLWNTGPRA